MCFIITKEIGGRVGKVQHTNPLRVTDCNRPSIVQLFHHSLHQSTSKMNHVYLNSDYALTIVCVIV